MNSQKLGLLLREAQRRKLAINPVDKILKDCFAEQRQFILDESRLKALICTRRAAKSMSACISLFKTCLENPNVSCLFLALTRQSAKKILWKDCIKFLYRKYNLQIELKEAALEVHFANGSILYLAGADTDPNEMNKLLGQKYADICIDEASFWRQDQYELVYSILKPAVADYRGSITLLGTPSNLLRSLFYDITKDLGRKKFVKGWRIFHWSALQNPYVAKQFREEMEELKRDNPGIEETPRYRQHYLSEWVIDTSKLVYKYKPSNVIPYRPTASSAFFYILSIDFGYNDETAFCITAYSDYDKTAYVVDSYKQSKMLLEDVAMKILYYEDIYHFDNIVVDGAGKQFNESLKHRVGLRFENADKSDKNNFIQLLNSDLHTGKLKIVNSNIELLDEIDNLIWHTKANGQKIEHPNCANHLTDAMLYGWRYCKHFDATDPEPELTEEEKMELEAEQEFLDRFRDKTYDYEEIGFNDEY